MIKIWTHHFTTITGDPGEMPSNAEVWKSLEPYHDYCADNFVSKWRWHYGQPYMDHVTIEMGFRVYLFVRTFEDATLFKLKFNAAPWQDYKYDVLPHHWDWSRPR